MDTGKIAFNSYLIHDVMYVDPVISGGDKIDTRRIHGLASPIEGKKTIVVETRGHKFPVWRSIKDIEFWYKRVPNTLLSTSMVIKEGNIDIRDGTSERPMTNLVFTR
jgi:hypothetical protein